MLTKNKNSWLKHWDFILADLLCINISFIFSFWLRLHGVNIYGLKEYRTLIITAMFLHFCIVFFSNHYSGILKRGYLKEVKAVLGYNVALIGCLFAYMFVTQTGGSVSRLLVVAFFFINTILMYLIHIVIKCFLKTHTNSEEKQYKIIIVTTGELAQNAIERIKDGPDKSYNIVGVCLDENSDVSEVDNIPVVAKGKDVYEYACRNVVDGVYICLDKDDNESIDVLTKNFLTMGVTVFVDMNMFSVDFPNVRFGRINGAKVMTTCINHVSPIEMAIKRTIDIAAGLAGCIITAVLFIFIAPAIKISDPEGPIFFGQERAGKNGRTFKIYKFRSMYSDAEERKKELMDKNKMDGLMFKIDADPRIIGSGPDGTKKGLGHFLRATSLDEFPNFWSILKGDMSLVGTRPPTMDEYEKYELHHKSRLAAKPGLTGLWQVSGRSDFTDFEEIVKLDNEYIKNWSIGLDIKIIFKTAWVVITRKGSV